MAYKTNPISLRLGKTKNWPSVWYSKNHFSKFLSEDLLVQKYFDDIFQNLDILIQEFQIIRSLTKITIKISICTAFASEKKLELFNEKKLFQRSLLHIYKLLNTRYQKVHLLLQEDKNNFLTTALTLSKHLARDIELNQHEPLSLILDNFTNDLLFYMSETNEELKKVEFLKALEKKAFTKIIKGLKIKISGCINGVRIASHESLIFGSLPLQTFQANIDYSKSTAFTINGTYGIKVWIYFA